jgi:hypothetical protein
MFTQETSGYDDLCRRLRIWASEIMVFESCFLVVPIFSGLPSLYKCLARPYLRSLASYFN